MESLIGAVFVDSGLDFPATWDVFRRLVSDRVLVETLTREIARNPTSVLDEMYPASCVYGKPIVRKDGQVEMTLDVANRNFRAVSRNKRQAKLELAKAALRELW